MDGISRVLKEGEWTNSFCGFAEYLAPEMIESREYNNSVDWWALGIVVFELLVGIPPFFNRNKNTMYYMISK